MIVILLVLGVTLTGLAIWITNFTVTRNEAQDIARKTELSITGTITDNLLYRGIESYEILINCLTQFQQGEKLGLDMMDTTNRTGIISVFTSFLPYSVLSGIIVTNDNASSMTGVFHDPDNEGELILSTVDDYSAGNLVVSGLDHSTLQRTGDVMVRSSYNLTERLWYSIPKMYGGAVWTVGSLVAAKRSFLSITLSTPYFLSESKTHGVAAVVLNFDQLSSLLRENILNATHSRAIIITTSGMLLGASVGENSRRTSNNDTEPIFAVRHSDRVIREAMIRVRRQFRNRETGLLEVNKLARFQFKDSTGVSRLVVLSQLSNTDTADWISVVILREKDVVGAMFRANAISLAVSLCMIVLSVFVATIVGFVFTIPLNRVSHQMKRIADMDFGPDNNQSTTVDRLESGGGDSGSSGSGSSCSSYGSGGGGGGSGSRTVNTLKLYELDHMVSSMGQMQKALDNFTKYVPGTVVKELARKNATVQLKVAPHLVTVLYLDIKDFTSLTESLDATVLIKILEEFFTDMSAILTEHHAIIDKFIGDCIMALFNVPHDIPHHQYQAVAASIRIHKRLEELNTKWQLMGYPLIEIRVGINTDQCLVGNVGSSSRVSYTALGEGVSTASRFENLNKVYGTKTIIGHNTFNHVSDKCLCMWLSHVSLPGRPAPVHIYSVLCFTEEATPTQIALCDLHNQAKEAYLVRDFPLMYQICETIVGMDANDLAAREWLDRMNESSFYEHLILHLGSESNKL